MVTKSSLLLVNVSKYQPEMGAWSRVVSSRLCVWQAKACETTEESERSLCVHTYVCTCACRSVHVCVTVRVCVHMCMHLCTHVCVHVWPVHVCVSVHVCVHMSMHLYMHECVHV